MPRNRKSQEPASRSTSQSPLASPVEGNSDSARRGSTVAFVPFDVGSSSGVSSETRKAVRIQAAKASAAARKRTIARKLALQNSAVDESAPAVTPDSERGRSHSVSSSLQAGFLVSPESPITNAGRSISAGQLESFNPYPASHWNPQVSALIDYFLRYFAPEDITATSSRKALRKTIWPQALNNIALFHAILLNVGSHASASGAFEVPTELLSQLKHSTIESVNDAVANSEAGGIGDDVIGAIAILGGWELEYGSSATYDTHMRGLETIVNLRGGLYGAQSPHAGLRPLSAEAVDLILAAGHDLPQYASKALYFADDQQATPIARHDTIPTGFASLVVQRLLPPSLVDLVSRIAHIVSIDNEGLIELGHIEDALAKWELSNATKASYSPFKTTLEDEMERQISSHICLAGQVICNYLRLTNVTGGQDQLEALYEAASKLQPDVLIGTLYEEATFWALFMICSLTARCETQHMLSLKWLSLELGINQWFACRQALGRYAYSSAMLDDRAYALWEAIESSTVARDPWEGLKEPTRFAKGIRHPTTHIGRAIVEERG